MVYFSKTIYMFNYQGFTNYFTINVKLLAIIVLWAKVADEIKSNKNNTKAKYLFIF